MAVPAFDAVVVGGGPAGATAAAGLASGGARVLLLDRDGRAKPCGGAVPTRLIADFAVPASQLSARIRLARMVAPSQASVDMPIDGGFVGMVDRERFDPWLRERARRGGAEVVAATFTGCEDEGVGIRVRFRRGGGGEEAVTARLLIGADGANSAVRRCRFGRGAQPPFVFAYHEIVRSPAAGFDPERCDVHYGKDISPDFYGWVFPHGPATSVGLGSARKGFDFRAAASRLRAAAGLEGAETLRREGAPLPLWPLRRWDDRRNTLLVGDAAGAVAPASGEGIHYAMTSGRLAADAGIDFLSGGGTAALASVRRRFMREHGRVFLALGLMQRFWYAGERRRERFVAICGHPDVQRLVWDAYLNKRLTWGEPLAHLRVLGANLRAMLGLAAP